MDNQDSDNKIVWNSNGEYHTSSAQEQKQQASGSGNAGQKASSGTQQGPSRVYSNPQYSGSYQGNGSRYSYNRGSNRNKSQSDSTIEMISWVINITLMAVVPAFGIVCLILKFCGIDIWAALLKGLRNANAPKGQKSVQTQQRQAQEQQQFNAAAKSAAASGQGTNTEINRRLKALKSIGTVGVVLAVIGSMILLGGVMELINIIAAALAGYGTYGLSSTLVALGIGGLLTGLGVNRINKKKRASRLFTMVGTDDCVEIGPMADAVGKKYDQTLRDVEYMCDKGCFGREAFVDESRGILFMNRAASERYMAKEADDAKARETAAERAKADEYQKLIYQISDANKKIKDEKMSKKIDRIQEITEAIFRKVQDEPRKRSQISTFMNFYLPTTLKLLNTYSKIEDEPENDSKNIADTKSQIEHITDTLIVGFEKQLDALYQSDAIDVAGDISALESMMKRDGFTESENELRADGSH
ncbi:MAG: 5-bromo-4-chloroindolyl phosphate hydrolysis family protein [Oscillospiraceae bacterium]|jgi:5-bromo-4-chloroindolyl phosphate hydrolysis protein